MNRERPLIRRRRLGQDERVRAPLALGGAGQVEVSEFNAGFDVFATMLDGAESERRLRGVSQELRDRRAVLADAFDRGVADEVDGFGRGRERPPSRFVANDLRPVTERGRRLAGFALQPGPRFPGATRRMLIVLSMGFGAGKPGRGARSPAEFPSRREASTRIRKRVVPSGPLGSPRMPDGFPPPCS